MNIADALSYKKRCRNIPPAIYNLDELERSNLGLNDWEQINLLIKTIVTSSGQQPAFHALSLAANVQANALANARNSISTSACQNTGPNTSPSASPNFSPQNTISVSSSNEASKSRSNLTSLTEAGSSTNFILDPVIIPQIGDVSELDATNSSVSEQIRSKISSMISDQASDQGTSEGISVQEDTATSSQAGIEIQPRTQQKAPTKTFPLFLPLRRHSVNLGVNIGVHANTEELAEEQPRVSIRRNSLFWGK